jgi:peptide deformylase
MAVRKLVLYPDPLLHTVSKPVEDFDDPDFQTLVDDMKDTVLATGGVGLSAIQVGVPLRVMIVIDTHPLNPEVIINPEILGFDGVQTINEGCLSVPGVFENRQRAQTVHTRYQLRNGEVFEHTFTDLEAFCFQHELDHLEGRVFVDDYSPLKKKRARDKIIKTARTFSRNPDLQGAY